MREALGGGGVGGVDADGGGNHRRGVYWDNTIFIESGLMKHQRKKSIKKTIFATENSLTRRHHCLCRGLAAQVYPCLGDGERLGVGGGGRGRGGGRVLCRRLLLVGGDRLGHGDGAHRPLLRGRGARGLTKKNETLATSP